MVNAFHIFDIDGTITPPRKPMEEDFFRKFFKFCSENDVVLVSGSDFNMIKEQIPEDILEKVKKVYSCSGIEGISFDVDYEINDQRFLDRLEEFLNLSIYDNKKGNHIVHRKGMINFSIVGRNANDEDRKHYAEFDSFFKERESIVKTLRKEFPDYEICIGGEISIDITKKGMDKSLVAKDLLTLYENPYMIFYGNRILDGNDYPLAKYIQDNNFGHSIQIDYENLKNIL